MISSVKIVDHVHCNIKFFSPYLSGIFYFERLDKYHQMLQYM
jgi:hypothetical protein